MTNTEKSIKNATLLALRGRKLADSKSPLLLMVSGGSDSCGLAYVMSELAADGKVGPLAMLHVNHGIRGKSADADQAFVETLAEALDIPLFTCAIDVPRLVEQERGNLEAIARRERYAAAQEALASLCAHVGAPLDAGRICVAHTQDDRVENFYMRSIVGTGPGGFASMSWKTGAVIRPLMGVSRQDIRDYLQARAQDAMQDASAICARNEEGALWCEDATNEHTDMLRAYVRHTIIPAAQERNGRLLDTLCRTMDLIADENDFLESLALQAMQTFVNWTAPAQDPLLSIMGGILPDTSIEVVSDGKECIDYSAGCVLAPGFAKEPLVVKRRAVFNILKLILPDEMRIENASVEAVLDGWKDGIPQGGYVVNIQGNLAVSANKHGVRIEPMETFRARRKRI